MIPTSWLISYNKNRHILPSVCTSLSYSNEAISARLLLIIHVSVICAAVHSHLEEGKGSSNAFLQVKRLMQIHPVSVNTCLNSTSTSLLMLNRQSVNWNISSAIRFMDWICTDMSPKAFLNTWFNPQHRQKCALAMLRVKSGSLHFSSRQLTFPLVMSEGLLNGIS